MLQERFRAKTCVGGVACLLAAIAVPLAVAQGINLDEGTVVMRVEEDWEAVLNDPGQDLTAPQFHTTMSPFGGVDSYYFVMTWNYRELVDFEEGGLQCRAWNGETELESKSFRGDTLSTSSETIRWTQSLRTTGDQLIFRVLNGQSTTWGSFGGSESRLAQDVAVASLNGYSSNVSVKNSWITYGSNRVNTIRIREVRYYDVNGAMVAKDSAPKVVYKLED